MLGSISTQFFLHVWHWFMQNTMILIGQTNRIKSCSEITDTSEDKSDQSNCLSCAFGLDDDSNSYTQNDVV